MLLASSASAADKYRYDILIRPATYNGTPSGYVSVSGLDTTKTVKIRVLRLAVEQYSTTAAIGTGNTSFSTGTITPGDQVEVQQPTGTVVETYTVPAVSITGTAGSPTVTGTVPAGSVATTALNENCSDFFDDVFPLTIAGTSFSYALPKALKPGGIVSVAAYPGKGDRVRFDNRLPGETACFNASSILYPISPGGTANPDPYYVAASGLNPSVTGARLVLRRGTTVLDDYSVPSATTSIANEIAPQPQPGDVLDLYRPNTAATPSASFTIPDAHSIYDPSNAHVAIDAPAALGVASSVGFFFTKSTNSRSTTNTPAGRTILDFSVAQGYDPAMSLKAPDYLETLWYAPDGQGQYWFAPTPGDLTAPILKLKLASKFKLSKIKSSFAASVSSSEATPSAKLTLTLPAKLKTARAKAPKLVASAKLSLKAGSNKVKLKLTKTGKKLLKTLRKGGYATQKVTVTVTATDAAGNAAATTKTTKLVMK